MGLIGSRPPCTVRRSAVGLEWAWARAGAGVDVAGAGVGVAGAGVGVAGAGVGVGVGTLAVERYQGVSPTAPRR